MAKSAGFSLIEIVVMMGILLILSSLAYKYSSGSIHETKFIRCRSELRTIREAAETFFLDHGCWPGSMQALVGDKFAALPLDPWHNQYLIDPFLYKAVSCGPNGVIDIPFGGMDGVADGHCYPGKWVGDDMFDNFISRPLLFVSERSGNPDVYSMFLNGMDTRNLTVNPANDENPILSPGGSFVLFQSDREGDFDIWLTDMTGGMSARLTSDSGDEIHPSFSPDGRRVLYCSDSTGAFNIMIMDLPADPLSSFTVQKRAFTTGIASDNLDPRFSPDSTRVVFASDRDGTMDLYLLNSLDHSSITGPLIQNGAANRSPSFSPDGRSICFHSDDDGDNEIYIAVVEIKANPVPPPAIDPLTVTRLTDNTSDDIEPTFSPDGSKILFSSDRTGVFEIFLMNLDGTNQTQLTTNEVIDHQADFSGY
ncbi:MAG: hypothetical protein PHQ23_15960 [Candidatus Wallbacteria bacterium]|nr:hypothetical protein [Candidatus Wallbacteria bacterium]